MRVGNHSLTIIGWTQTPGSHGLNYCSWFIQAERSACSKTGTFSTCTALVLSNIAMISSGLPTPELNPADFKNEKWSFHSSYSAVEIKGMEVGVQSNIHWPFGSVLVDMRKISGSLEGGLSSTATSSLHLFCLPDKLPILMWFTYLNCFMETACRVWWLTDCAGPKIKRQGIV